MTGGELLVAYLRRQTRANAKVTAFIEVIARTQEQDEQADRRRLQPVRDPDGRSA
jgi:hypothetical protein